MVFLVKLQAKSGGELYAEKTYPVERIERNLLSVSTISDYAKFTKARLASLVVLSAALTYAYASDVINWPRLWLLVLGGFLVTGASNGINQIIEKDTDRLMKRTANRPLPTGRMSLTEAWTVAIIFALSGTWILWHYLNPLSGILGFIALLLYTAAYTPLKKISSVSVFVGAFPGAIPPLLGWVAATGEFSIQAWIVFFIQFIWQFPHFWAIAWKSYDDYKAGGFKMLPGSGERDRNNAFQILVYSISLIPISMLPLFFNMSGVVSAAVLIIAGLLFTWQALLLFRKMDDESASKLMFASFIYLPVVQLALLLDKI